MAQDDPNQAQAGAGTGSGTETPQGAQADSLNNPGKEQTLDERLSGARSQADVLKLIDDARGGRVKSATAPEANSPETNGNANAGSGGEGEGTAQNAGEANNGGESEGSATSGAGESAAGAAGGEGAGTGTGEAAGEKAAGAEGGEGAGKGEGEGDGGDQLPERIRLTNFSDVEKLALQLKRTAAKNGETITLAEAETRAKAALGIKDQSAQTGAADTGKPKTVAEVDAKIAELKAARTKARTEDLDFKEADRLDNEIDALREHKLTLREQTAETASKEQAAYNKAFDAAEGQASGLYDFVKQAESEGFKRMAEIDRQLEANRDPLFNDPSKPLVIAQMVARELKIAPKSPTAAKPGATGKPVVTARPAVSTTVPPKKTVPPVASGASRTSTSTTQGDAVSKEIDQLRTPADLENFLAKMQR